MLKPRNKSQESDVLSYRIEWDDNRVDMNHEVTPETIKAASWAALETAVREIARVKRADWRAEQPLDVSMVRNPKTGECQGYVASGVQAIGHFTLRHVPS